MASARGECLPRHGHARPGAKAGGGQVRGGGGRCWLIRQGLLHVAGPSSREVKKMIGSLAIGKETNQHGEKKGGRAKGYFCPAKYLKKGKYTK
jgi:hypothetical protein